MKHVLANANDSTIPMENLDTITTFMEFTKEECNSDDIEISNKISKGRNHFITYSICGKK
jgi:hypothetical protein